MKIFDHNADVYNKLDQIVIYTFKMDLFDVAEHGGTVNAGLAKIHTKKNLIIGVESDILFPIDQQQELADGLSKAKKNIKFEKLQSIQGHDSFLVDEKRFSKVIYEFFNN